MNYRKIISSTFLSAALILFALIPAVVSSTPSPGASRQALAPTRSGTDKVTALADQAAAGLRGSTKAQIVTQASRETGVFSFVRANGDGVLAEADATASPEARARTFLAANGGLVGMTEAERNVVGGSAAAKANTGAALELANVATDDIGATHVKFNQSYAGLKVFGAQLIVHMNDRGITAVNGNYIPEIAVDTYPTLNSQAAAKEALISVTKGSKESTGDLSVIESQLAIYRTGLLEGYKGTNLLAYGIKVADGAGPLEQVWLDAKTGAELIRIPLRHAGLHRRV